MVRTAHAGLSGHRCGRKAALAAVVAACVTIAGAYCAARPMPARAPGGKVAAPHLVVYRGATATLKVNAFAGWLGYPGIWAEDFMPDSSWDAIAFPTWQTGPWGAWVKHRAGRRLLLGVTLLPGPWNRSGPTVGKMGVKQPVSLAAGARGKYNAYFKMLAKNLVAHGLGNSILRLGWEFNGGWYTSRAHGNPKAFAAYWRQIVTTMRSVPGGRHLRFCWNPTAGYVQFPAAQAWPGRRYVDYVGVDAYDQCWAKETYPLPPAATAAEKLQRQKAAWKFLYAGPQGLRYWSRFARKRHRPLAVPEWGVDIRADGHGGMDDPYFVRQMHAFLCAPRNHVAFDCYFEFRAPDGDHQLSPGVSHFKTQFPRAAAVFRKLFAKPRG